jgi:hypothetical protein
MKKTLLTFFISGALISSYAQAPTWDFETWTGTGASIEPSGWLSENAVVLPPLYNNVQSVFQATGADTHSGTYAMKIVTVALVSNPDPATIPDPMGAAWPGKINYSPLSLKDGLQFTGRPATVDFWYKYAPTGSDSASCLVILSKWNTSRDTIATGGWVLKTAVSSYALSTMNLVYNPAFSTMLPDTMRIYFSATCWFPISCGKVGSTLWVDDIAFNGWNGVNENPNAIGVTLFPNPASDFATISVDALNEAYSATAYDATGRIVSTIPLSSSTNGMNRRSGIINTSGLASGFYSYTINDNNGNPLRSGKFSVVK